MGGGRKYSRCQSEEEDFLSRSSRVSWGHAVTPGFCLPIPSCFSRAPLPASSLAWLSSTAQSSSSRGSVVDTGKASPSSPRTLLGQWGREGEEGALPILRCQDGTHITVQSAEEVELQGKGCCNRSYCSTSLSGCEIRRLYVGLLSHTRQPVQWRVVDKAIQGRALG